MSESTPSTPPAGEQRRLAAIVFTDVVGYSARMQRDETGTMKLVAADFALMRERCAQHGGELLNSMGDGLLLCFGSAVQAVACALQIQSEFAARRAKLPPEQALEHRMGVHIGDVFRQETGGVAGDGVNIAARLEGKAPVGGVCVSQMVYDTVKGKLPMQAVFVGPETFKNITEPIPIWHLAAGDAASLSRPPMPVAKPKRRTLSLAVGAMVAVLVAAVVLWAPWKKSAPADGAALTAEFPRNPELKRARALIYATDSIAGDFALADDLLKPLLAAQPNDPEVVAVAAELDAEYLTRGFDISQSRRAQAQRLTERAVQLAPDNPAALAVLGRYLRFTRTQLGRAEDLLRRAIAIDPTEPRYYRILYSVLVVAKPGVEAEKFSTQMLALFPNDPLAIYEVAVLHQGLGELEVAEQWLDKSLALAPLANAITWKAKLMLEVHGDVEGMKRWLDRMPERQLTGARLADAYSVAALVTGQTATTRRLLDVINDTWLADGTYIFPKAMLVADLDAIDGNADTARINYEAALAEIRRALAADPTDLRPHRAALWVQLALGHRDETLAELRLNLQRRPTPYQWTMNHRWWTSTLRACLLLGERAEAITELKEATVEAQGRLLLRNLFHVDPKMAPFRDDPEIVALLADPAAKNAAK